MKTRDLIKVLERQGFYLLRQGEHKIYSNGVIEINIPHSRTTSSGMVHQAFKSLKSLNKAA